MTLFVDRNGQVEMIGMVIVVVLLVLGALFFLKFGILRGENEINSKPAVDASYGSNFLNAISNIKYCEKYSLSEVLDSCYNDKIMCDKEACSYLNEEIKAISEFTGLKKNKKYSIWVERTNWNKSFSNECSSGVKTDIRLVNVDNEVYTLNLQLC